MSQFRLYALIKEIKRDVLCILGCISVVLWWLLSILWSGQEIFGCYWRDLHIFHIWRQETKQSRSGLRTRPVWFLSRETRQRRGDQLNGSVLTECLKTFTHCYEKYVLRTFCQFLHEVMKKLYFWTFKMFFSWSYERSSPFDHFANIIKIINHLKS